MNNCYPFKNTPLPYDYNALEPYIDCETMRLHHDKHLQGYIDKLNGVLFNCRELQSSCLEQLITTGFRLRDSIRCELRKSAGGVYNHRFFFDSMTQNSHQPCDGMLYNAICKSFGGIKPFMKEFKTAALSVFGSGYAWLVATGNYLRIITLPNQATPLDTGYKPILCIDVWEHAYYLQYQNRRAEYAEGWFDLINWRKAGKRYEDALGGCM